MSKYYTVKPEVEGAQGSAVSIPTYIMKPTPVAAIQYHDMKRLKFGVGRFKDLTAFHMLGANL